MSKKQQVMVPAELIEKANGLDVEARRLWGEMDSHLTAAEVISIPFGKVCTEMKALELHKFVRKSGSRKGYPEFSEWIQSITKGKLSKSSLYMAMGLHRLTEGPNAIPVEDVVQMPKENAYRVATQLEPEQRTPDIIADAKRMPKEKFPKRIQEKLNEGKPADQQSRVKSIFHREMDFNICNMLEDCIEEFTQLEVVRDGDQTLTLQEKAIAAIVTSARTHCADLLAEVRRKREAETAVAPDLAEAEHEADSALATQEVPEFDPEEREIIRETEYVSLEEAEAGEDSRSAQDFS